jgi:hypothetical protein
MVSIPQMDVKYKVILNKCIHNSYYFKATKQHNLIEITQEYLQETEWDFGLLAMMHQKLANEKIKNDNLM